MESVKAVECEDGYRIDKFTEIWSLIIILVFFGVLALLLILFVRVGFTLFLLTLFCASHRANTGRCAQQHTSRIESVFNLACVFGVIRLQLSILGVQSLVYWQ